MDFVSLMASFQTMVNFTRGVINERDRQKFAAIQDEFAKQLAAANTQFLELQGSVIAQQRLIPALEQRIRELEAERCEKERYELAEIGSCGKFFVYRLRPPAELKERADETPHMLCQPCFEAGKKHVLNDNGSGYISCPVCNRGRQVFESSGPTIRSGRPRADWSAY